MNNIVYFQIVLKRGSLQEDEQTNEDDLKGILKYNWLLKETDERIQYFEKYKLELEEERKILE